MASETITHTYHQGPIGNQLAHQDTSISPYGNDSQRFDAAITLYQLRARNYCPTIGRFLSRD